MRLAGLTPKQQRFVEEYLIDLNATQAAIRAGYSTETANEIGCENLAKPYIRSHVDKAIAEQSRRTGITADRVMREMARIGFANIGQILDDASGGLLDNLSDDDLAAISSVKTKTLRVDRDSDEIIVEREIKFHDKGKALELLGKHLGMFIDKLEINGNMVTFKGEDKLED